MPWKMRYAPSLGLDSVRSPMFLNMVDSVDPIQHIRFIADRGFSGAFDNFLKQRPAEEQNHIGQELARRGLEMGCFIGNIETWNKPSWGLADEGARHQLQQDLLTSVEAARRTGGRCITTLGGVTSAIPLALQLTNMIENLKWLSSIAEDADVVLGVEVTNEWAFPGLLVHNIFDGYQVVKAVNSPAVRLVFDVYHVQAMNGDVIANLDRVWDVIGVIQVADNPGRFEMGTGELNWVNILRHIRNRGYGGLIELEHAVSRPGHAGEEKVLRELRHIDDSVDDHPVRAAGAV